MEKMIVVMNESRHVATFDPWGGPRATPEVAPATSGAGFLGVATPSPRGMIATGSHPPKPFFFFSLIYLFK
jgi:hypothetical protein